jgi:hypothetical protein
MPLYKVIAPGFYDSKYYHPEGKRNVLYTDKPFSEKNPMPSWLTDMPEESEVVKAKREAFEAAQAELAAAQVAEDKEDIANASSTGDGVDSSFLTETDDSLVDDTIEQSNQAATEESFLNDADGPKDDIVETI